MDNIFLKTIFNKGSKGSKGEPGINIELPTNSVIAYDGETAPTGYEVTTDPRSGGASPAIELLCKANAQGQAVVGKANYSYNMTPGSNYSNYLSFDSTNSEFTVLQNFKALIVPWTYNYNTASASYSKGEFYINNTLVRSWSVDYRPEGYYRGNPILVDLTANDTMYGYTPTTDGYPEQFIKIYKIKDSDTLTNLYNLFMLYDNVMTNLEGIYNSV